MPITAFQLECVPDSPNYALDPKLLTHILTNLITNAIKYSPRESEVLVKVDEVNQDLQFMIRDNGIGIPVDEQPYLFEPFHRCNNVGNTAGTGLGLAIVKRSVELHQGTITLESAPDKGTTFLVQIPISK